MFTNCYIFRIVIGFLCFKLQTGVKIRKTKYYSDKKLTSLELLEGKNMYSTTFFEVKYGVIELKSKHAY